MNRKVQVIIIVFLTTLAYINIFQNQFVIDDKTFIVNWEKIRNLGNIVEFFKGAVPAGHEGVYRPVRSVLYTLYYQIWETNPVGYHLHSILVHLISTILVYLIVEQLVLRLHLGGGKLKYVPFIGGLLFGLHPVHTESITYISASMEMTGVVFFLLAFLMYLRSLTHARPGLARLASYFFAFLAFFTNEVTLVLPFLIILYEVVFKKFNIRNSLWYFAGFVGYLIARLAIDGELSRGDYFGGNFYLTLLSIPLIIGKYLSLLVFPVNLAHNHILLPGLEAILYRGYRVEALKQLSFFHPSILIPILITGGLLLLAVKIRRKNPLITFGIGWFYISLLPVLNLIPQFTLLHERFLYLSSIGLALVVAGLLIYLPKAVLNPTLFLSAVLFSILFVLTWDRNNDWRSAVSLWTQDIKLAPAQNAYAYFQLGEAYLAEGKKEEAIKSYKQAFEINPHFAVAAGSVARTYGELGKTDLAIEFYQKAIKADPNFWEGVVNLQNLLDKNQKWVRYSGLGLTFSYPKGWVVSSKYQVVSIKGNNGQFIIEMETKDRKNSIPEQYFNSQTETYGKLINQGLAQIPNFDQAYVKIWSVKAGLEQVQKMEFFLFKDNKVVKILVYPSDSPLMRIFDKIVGSIKFL